MDWYHHALAGAAALGASIVCGAADAPASKPAPSPPPADAVGHAVERGRKDLRRRFQGMLARSYEDYPVGRIAFPLAALLKAGEPPGDEIVDRAFEKLEALSIEKTYCAATYLFALDALLERRRQEAAGGGAGSGPPGPGRVTEKARMEQCVRWLVEAQSPSHGSWTYDKEAGKDARHDFSNTQFAVLALAIGRKHGIEVPREVFTRVAALLAGAITLQGAPAEHEILPALTLEERLRTSRPPPLRVRSAPGGWGYRDPRKGRPGGQPRQKPPPKDAEDGEVFGNAPYASMTAAGASSLIIALDALRSSPPRAAGAPSKRRSPPAKAPPVDEARVVSRAEQALHSAYAWISSEFESYVANDRRAFYTLYSLEKVGDLGRIERFGGRDWYAEGAALLIEKQRGDGGWGSYIDTSFALLFLVRATRLLDARSAPAIYTGPGEGGRRSDLVYIDRVKGFLSAGAVLAYMGETRKPELVELGKEVLEHFPPDRREDLAPHLLALWTKPDAVTSFARRALAEVTGAEAVEKAACATFVKSLESVMALEEKTDPSAEETALLLSATASPRLKARIVSLASRKDLRALAGLLVDEMSVPSGEYRERVHGVLTLWTGQLIRAPDRKDAKGWDSVAEAWKVWWSRREAGVPR